MTIKLTKDGKFLSREWVKPTQWNEETRRYEDEGYYEYIPLTTAESVVLKWNANFLLGEGVTLRSLMTALRDIPDIEEIGPFVVNAYIREFIDEAFTSAKSDDKIVEIIWSWVAECGKDYMTGDDFDDPKANCREASNVLQFYGNVTGRAAGPEKCEYTNHVGLVNYSIDYSPQSTFMDCRLVADETFEIRDRNAYSVEPKFTAIKPWTLGEFLYTYLYELSWHGSPKGRDEFNEMLSKQFEEIKDGTAKLYAMEDLDRAMMGDEFVDDLIEKGEYNELPPI